MNLFTLLLFNSLLTVVPYGYTVANTQEAITSDIAQTLPPDPGPAGKKTLEGIDSDHDGVRDDVQRWIALTYPNSEKTRAVLSQSTKTMQQYLLNAADPIATYENAKRMDDDLSCFGYILSSELSTVSSEHQAIFLNTYQRSKVWLQADKHLSGHKFKGLDFKNWKQGCNFDPDTMPN